MMEITRKEKNYEVLYWVTMARLVDKEDSRVNIKSLLIENDLAICTDGHRMHVGRLTEAISPGTYNIVKRTLETIILEPSRVEFPEWQIVLPPPDRKSKRTILVRRPDGEPGTVDKTYTDVIRAIPDDRTIRFLYFSEMVGTGHSGGSIKYYGDSEPFIFVLPGFPESSPYQRMGALMPMRMTIR
jgi:hypothetical protein